MAEFIIYYLVIYTLYCFAPLLYIASILFINAQTGGQIPNMPTHLRIHSLNSKSRCMQGESECHA